MKMPKFRAFLSELSNSPVRFFVGVAFIFGTSFIIAIPPLQSPDETVHLYRAYQVSEFDPVVNAKDHKVGGDIPESIPETINKVDQNIAFSPSKKYVVRATVNSLEVNLNKQEKKFVDFSSTASNTPFSYIPQAVGIFFGRIFNFPPILIIYLGRFSNLFFYIAIMALSIRLIPFKKWAFAFVALLPMSVAQAASLSTDALVFGTAALFVSTVFYLKQEKSKVANKHVAFLIGACVLMVLCKQVLVALLPLVLLLPQRIFANKTQAFTIKMLSIILPILTLAFWYVTISSISMESSYSNGQMPNEQIKFVLLNPHHFINVLWNTFFFHWGDGITRSVIGTFGWVDTPLALIWVIVGFVGLFIVAAAKVVGAKEPLKLNRKERFLMSSAIILYCILVSAALYAYYTPVGYKIVYGLQGRYFIPVLFLAIPLLAGNWLSIKAFAYKKMTIFLPLVLLSASLLTIIYRYYINNV